MRRWCSIGIAAYAAQAVLAARATRGCASERVARAEVGPRRIAPAGPTHRLTLNAMTSANCVDPGRKQRLLVAMHRHERADKTRAALLACSLHACADVGAVNAVSDR
jgi:hypothetical protein